MNSNRIQGELNEKLIFFRLVDFSIIAGTLVIFVLYEWADWKHHHSAIMFIATLSFFIAAELSELYRPWRTERISKLLLVVSACWLIAFFSVIAYMFFFKVSASVSRLTASLWFTIVLVELIIWRVLFRLYLENRRKKGADLKKVCIIGMTNAGIRLGDDLINNAQSGLVLEGYFDDRAEERLAIDHNHKYLGNVEKALVLTRLGAYDVVYIAIPLSSQERINSILRDFSDTMVVVHVVPDFFTFNLLNARFSQIGSTQTVSVYESPYGGASSIAKRAEDIFVSFFILCLIALPMLVIAVLIKLDSKGPVLFKQKRYGLDGRQISVWKFRSMTSLDNGGTVKQATKGDARITKLGAILRRTSLDELPQFFNSLGGSMSVVGPRPHAVSHNEEYRQAIEFYMLRHRVKPGITGWAQINGWRGETDTLDKMEMRVKFDLHYIRHWSLYLDLKIIFLTVFKGFVNKNAY